MKSLIRYAILDRFSFVDTIAICAMVAALQAGYWVSSVLAALLLIILAIAQHMVSKKVGVIPMRPEQRNEIVNQHCEFTKKTE